ncbi:MAG: CoA ester lyase, partial [Chloroflexi bacterium]|nr:CoA ester lyase [Chloroflexota bacterium]
MTAAVARLRAAPPRSWLFVPALKAREWLPKAIAAGADAVILDLEDATAPSEKERAREVVRGLALEKRERPFIAVRVNGSPPAVEDDCAAAVASGADAVILPKVEGTYQVRRACALLEGSDLAVLPMIETARAVLVALDLAEADERVGSLMFGGGDLAA